MTETIRARLYPTALAIAALAVAYGYVTETEAGLWVGLFAALTGTTTATAYRPKPGKEPAP